jgi:hypothetical protein
MTWLAGQVIGGLVGASVTIILAWLTRRGLTNAERRAWRVRHLREVTVVLSTSARVTTPTYDRPVTGLGPARSLGLLAPSLVKAYDTLPEDAVMLSAFVRDSDRAGDLVLLGGPKNNAVTREALHRLDRLLPITMETRGDEVILVRDQYHDEEALSPASTHAPSRGRSGADYGLIIRAVNCFDPSGTLTIFAGSHTYGTVAAAEYFLRHRKEFRRMQGFAVVVKSHVTAEEHVEPASLLRGPIRFELGTD